MLFSTKRERILYIGYYLDTDTVKERGLPAFNVAGSNRMYRLARSLSAVKQKVLVVSPAASMRMRWTQPFHRSNAKRSNQIPVLFCPAFGFSFANAIAEPFMVLWSLIVLCRKYSVKTAIIYNFSPSLLFATFFLKYILGVRVFNNVEDISRPKIKDWIKDSEARPLQEIVLSICMDSIAFISEGFIVPTKRFLDNLPNNKPAIIVSGCMPRIEACAPPNKAQLPINILFSGKLEFEHGIHFLLNAIHQLETHFGSKINRLIEINICGSGSKSNWLRDELEKLKHARYVYHGFVSNNQYKEILKSADVCVALQDPKGRYKDYKTPSKVYEYLGCGKLVIATEVGDLPNLPREMVEICGSDVGNSLYVILKRVIENSDAIDSRKEFAAHYSLENFSFPVVGNDIAGFIMSS